MHPAVKRLADPARRHVRAVASKAIGPEVRRIRRGIQWHARGVNFRVDRRGAEPFPNIAASHATPLIRALPGVDQQLQRNKVVNLRIAAARLDSVILEPGVCLSFWREVGKPSRRRGFLDGMVLVSGEVAVGVGGGLCQMTNLLYWMTLHTPLSVTERWRHSYDVFPDTQRTQPFGSGATCAWPQLDLQIQNDTSMHYRLQVSVTDTHLVGSWTTPKPLRARYEIEERHHLMSNEAPGVYVRRNELWRLEYGPENTLLSEEMVVANAALMRYAPFLPAPRQGGSP